MKRKRPQTICTDHSVEPNPMVRPLRRVSVREAKQKLADGFYHHPMILQTIADRILQTMHTLQESSNATKRK